VTMVEVALGSPVLLLTVAVIGASLVDQDFPSFLKLV